MKTIWQWMQNACENRQKKKIVKRLLDVFGLKISCSQADGIYELKHIAMKDSTVFLSDNHGRTFYPAARTWYEQHLVSDVLNAHYVCVYPESYGNIYNEQAFPFTNDRLKEIYGYLVAHKQKNPIYGCKSAYEMLIQFDLCYGYET